jgi:hypothetical protein
MAVVLIGLVILAVVVLFPLGSEGLLPWQPEPTRIPITPFADIPGDDVGTPSP